MRTKLVVVFTDEQYPKILDELFRDLEETDCRKVKVFDDRNKVIIDVPSEIPDPDYPGTLQEYWKDVIDESLNPPCYSSLELVPGVWRVMTEEEFQATQS